MHCDYYRNSVLHVAKEFKYSHSHVNSPTILQIGLYHKSTMDLVLDGEPLYWKNREELHKSVCSDPCQIGKASVMYKGNIKSFHIIVT